MSRLWLRLVAVAVVTLVLVVGAAAAVYAVTLPYFVAAVLTRLSGRAVELDDVELRPSQSLLVQVRGLRVYAGPEPSGEVQVEIPEIEGRHAWPRLFAGELVPRSWTLRGGRIQVTIGQPGEAGPTLHDLLTFAAIDVRVHETRLDLLLPDEERIRLDGIELELRREERPIRLRGRAHAWLESSQQPLGEIEAVLDLGGSDARAEIRLRDLDLARLPRGPLPEREGRASGTLDVTRTGEDLELAYELDVAGFRLRHEELSSPLAPVGTRLRGSAAYRADRLEIALHELALDDLVARGTIEIDSEVGDAAHLRAALRLDGFELGEPTRGRVNPLALLGLRFATFERLDTRIEAGRVETGTIDLDLPLDDLADALAFERKLDASELRLEASLRGGVYRPNPGSDPLENVSGSIAVAGNALIVREARMSRRGSALPRIDLELQGMDRLVRLPREERNTPPGPGVPIPGLGPATRALRAAPTADGEELLVELRDARLAHPAFVLELRDARGEIRFPHGSLAADLHGVLGGAPARVECVWNPDARTVVARVEYEDGAASPPPTRPPRGWASGRIRARALQIGPWRLERIVGRVVADGSFVELADASASLAGGSLRAQGTVSIGEPDEAPYGFTTELHDAQGSQLGPALGLGEDTLSGIADFRGSWTGRLRPGRPFLAGAHLGGSFEVVRGQLARLPFTVVIARLPSLQGVRGLFGQPLPFDRLTAGFTLDAGVIRTQDFALEGPQLRMLAAGEIGVLAEENPTDMVVALLFLETIDRMLGQVPLVGRWMLGADRNLIALYVRLEGPWRSPRASLVPPSALQTAAGWAGGIIGEGARRLRSIFAGEVEAQQLDRGAR